MLVGLLRLIFNLISWVMSIAGWLLLVYVIMSAFAPQNKYTQLVGKYIEPVLSPIRAWLGKAFPKLGASRLDLSPIALWLALEVGSWLVGIIRNILL